MPTLLVAACRSDASTAPTTTALGAPKVYRVDISASRGSQPTITPYSVAVLHRQYVDFVFNVSSSITCELVFGRHTLSPLPPDIDWAHGSRTVRLRFLLADWESETALSYTVWCRHDFYPGVFNNSAYVLVW